MCESSTFLEKTSKISLSLSGKRAVIMDMDSGKVVHSKNAKEKCHNASTTKLMTAIVAVEKNKSLNKEELFLQKHRWQIPFFHQHESFAEQ